SVRTENQHAHAGDGDAKLGVVEYLFGFLDDLELFLVVAAVLDGAVVRKEIEGDLVREYLLFCRTSRQHIAGLKLELLHRPGPSAGSGLISRNHGAPDTVHPVDRIKRHDHNDGATIGRSEE